MRLRADGVVQQVSITFDPFMYLTLPLPVHKKWRHVVYYVPWDVSKPHQKASLWFFNLLWRAFRNAAYRCTLRLPETPCSRTCGTC
jgi:hypothetical protein